MASRLAVSIVRGLNVHSDLNSLSTSCLTFSLLRLYDQMHCDRLSFKSAFTTNSLGMERS